MKTESQKLTALAKLTLSLEVLGRMENGYHQISTLMTSLDLSDTLEVEEDEIRTYVRIKEAREEAARIEAAGMEAVPQGAENLVAVALELVGKKATVTIQKNIPPGAGLGGGSSNAAAVLRWAGFSDLAGAAKIGADVPFCLAGGRAQVGGIGEIVEPVAFVEETYTLLIPPIACSTAEVYAAWDELGGPKSERGGNDLEPAALVVAPELAIWRDKLAKISDQRPRLAGSGSTWFVKGEFVEGELAGGESVEGELAGGRLVVARTVPAA